MIAEDRSNFYVNQTNHFREIFVRSWPNKRTKKNRHVFYSHPLEIYVVGICARLFAITSTTTGCRQVLADFVYRKTRRKSASQCFPSPPRPQARFQLTLCIVKANGNPRTLPTHLSQNLASFALSRAFTALPGLACPASMGQSEGSKKGMCHHGS